METLITAKNINKTFGNGPQAFQALNQVSVSIREGEFVSVMGASGSGKSTLLYALSGMDDIDDGTIRFAGKELSSCRETERADLRRTAMGFVFQQPTLLKNLNILDNIILPAMRSSRKDAGQILKKARRLMQVTGIAGLEDRMITQVSGGQLQRAGICRALMSNPQIIFGDEPTGALNSKTAQEIMALLLEINRQGTAVCLVTHDVRVAAQSERVLLMQDGRIIDEVKLLKYDGTNLETRVAAISGRMQNLV